MKYSSKLHREMLNILCVFVRFDLFNHRNSYSLSIIYIKYLWKDLECVVKSAI